MIWLSLTIKEFTMFVNTPSPKYTTPSFFSSNKFDLHTFSSEIIVDIP